MIDKLGIVVPYRDRKTHLRKFIHHISTYVDIPYEVVVIEQFDDKAFNRGKLLNIGYLKALELGCTYLVFHDIDMLPINVDYSKEDKVTHLIGKLKTGGELSRHNFDEYTGGVTLVPVDVFKRVNGYTNNYWGWGFEDDNFLLRLEREGEVVNRKIVKQLVLNKKVIKLPPNSYAAVPNVLNNRDDFTITVDFTINSMLTDPKEITDIQSVFSIPGWDTTLSYNSFQHFTFQFWKKDLSSMSLTTKEHFPDGSYRAVIVISNSEKKVTFYLNDSLVGHSRFDSLRTLRTKEIYLGVGDPRRKSKQNWSDCSISSFKIESDKVLLHIDAEDIQDGKLVDRVSDKEIYLHKSSVETLTTEQYVDVTIPFRKNGVFKALKHKENGYVDGYWKSWQSRENQIDYYNCKYSPRNFYWCDGISSLEYEDVNVQHKDKRHLYKVRL